MKELKIVKTEDYMVFKFGRTELTEEWALKAYGFSECLDNGYHSSFEDENDEEQIAYRGAAGYIENEYECAHEVTNGKTKFYDMEAYYVLHDEYGRCKLITINDDGSVIVNRPAKSKKKQRAHEPWHKAKTTLAAGTFFPQITFK